MANYVLLGRSGEGAPLVQVSIGSIDQEQPVVEEMAIVDAVRERLLLVPGVEAVVARRYEQVITVV